MKQMKVLVVDDDASITEVLQVSLAKAGYDVTVAFSGNSAYALIAAESFGTVVSDVDLPEPRSLIPVDGVPFIGVHGQAMAAVCERLSRKRDRREETFLKIPALNHTV